jgi:Wiskott-Aldrich syndrome protein
MPYVATVNGYAEAYATPPPPPPPKEPPPPAPTTNIEAVVSVPEETSKDPGLGKCLISYPPGLDATRVPPVTNNPGKLGVPEPPPFLPKPNPPPAPELKRDKIGDISEETSAYYTKDFIICCCAC